MHEDWNNHWRLLKKAGQGHIEALDNVMEDLLGDVSVKKLERDGR